MVESKSKTLELSDKEYKKLLTAFRLAALAALAILGIGMVFYHFVQHLSWVDAFYFCVVTLTTIGYGDISPVTNAEKIFTSFYILAGVGIIATFANLFVKRAVASRARR